ncbi:hypothetical protein KPH14_011277 [Odynerus spinipes]|uniref:Uncharacterized protein n=1 Tax=Odynerus spinipes TaxID=1348599 RepID=A0AAD9R9Z2_9HYME|nr:hypothetical protein KPH14_011277 [Odynerus spinipes]
MERVLDGGSFLLVFALPGTIAFNVGHVEFDSRPPSGKETHKSYPGPIKWQNFSSTFSGQFYEDSGSSSDHSDLTPTLQKSFVDISTDPQKVRPNGSDVRQDIRRSHPGVSVLRRPKIDIGVFKVLPPAASPKNADRVVSIG